MKTQKIKSLTFTHLSGSKNGQVEKVSFNDQEVVIGRSNESDLRFGSGDDAVSRKHAQIEVKYEDGVSVQITDLNSTNGLFVNDQKVTGTTDLMPMDKIQLGKGGPVVEFDLDPRPESLSSKTRVISVPEYAATREISVDSGATEEVLSKIDEALSTESKATLGKETVERMIKKSEKKGSLRVWVLSFIAIAAVALTAFQLLKPDPVTPYNEPKDEGMAAWTPQRIASEYGESIVMINASYKLVYTPTGEDIYHYYDLIDGVVTPLYVPLTDGRIEPFCVAGKPNEFSRLMSNSSQGTGFVVNPEGFIMTNRHVAASWYDTYGFPEDAFPGRLIYSNDSGGYDIDMASTILPDDLSGFIPANMATLNNSNTDNKFIDGSTFFLDILFPGDDTGIPATISRVSNKHDVALLKIDYPGRIKSVNLKDIDISPGQQVTVMGYPAVSPTEYRAVDSKTFTSSQRKYKQVANPSIFDGLISKHVGDTFDNESSFSELGDSYELTINATGSGNSGGPLFDDEGNVIGIFYATMSRFNGDISFAVPIEYGLELMGIKSNFK